MPVEPSESDSELVARLVTRDEEALRLLHRRHAALVFTVASRIVDPSAAEEVVQDVFMTLWKKPEAFDARKGALGSWLRRVARNAALNMRRRAGAAALDEDAEAHADDALPADEALWSAHRRSVLRAAIAALPAAQREALSLAYFDELTQEQVAAALKIPVGTTKTRIRLGLRRLAALVAATLGVLLLFLGWRRAERQAETTRQALVMVTSSDVVPRRLTAVAGIDPAAHATFRARAGASLVVITASHLPGLAAGEHYSFRARHGDNWMTLGTIELYEDGSGLTVFEVKDALPVDELVVTRDVQDARGAPVVSWTP